MRTEGIYTSHRFVINHDKYNEPIYLIPFGDVHKFSPMHSKNHWKSFLDWAKTKKRAIFLGMGDYIDIGSTSERFILNDPHLHDSTKKTLEELYLQQVMAFCKDIEFMRGRLIGVINGNHYGYFQSGITTDQKIADIMGCKYLGCTSLVRLAFHHTKRKTPLKLDLYLHHGRGGGRTAGASMNPVRDMVHTADADIYLMGDNHQKGLDTKSHLRLVGDTPPTLRHRKILFGRTGSFLKGYEEGEVSYVADANLPPSDLGVLKIELTPKRQETSGTEEHWIDIHASL